MLMAWPFESRIRICRPPPLVDRMLAPPQRPRSLCWGQFAGEPHREVRLIETAGRKRTLLERRTRKRQVAAPFVAQPVQNAAVVSLELLGAESPGGVLRRPFVAGIPEAVCLVDIAGSNSSGCKGFPLRRVRTASGSVTSLRTSGGRSSSLGGRYWSPTCRGLPSAGRSRGRWGCHGCRRAREPRAMVSIGKHRIALTRIPLLAAPIGSAVVRPTGRTIGPPPVGPSGRR